MVGLAALGDDLGPCILSRLVNEFEDFPRVSRTEERRQNIHADGIGL